jgi:GGDEF domain-containing protein
MDDFREQLTAVIDTMRLEGNEPLFLVVDLDGIEEFKKAHGAESVEKFRAAAVEAVSGAAQGSDAFTYGEDRIVAILAGYDRLKTFALIDRLRRSLPLLGQSFDCVLAPDFDVLEYDVEQGVAGLMNYLVRPRVRLQDDVA